MEGLLLFASYIGGVVLFSVNALLIDTCDFTFTSSCFIILRLGIIIKETNPWMSTGVLRISVEGLETFVSVVADVSVGGGELKIFTLDITSWGIVSAGRPGKRALNAETSSMP